MNEEIPRLESLLDSANSSIETLSSQLSDQASHISSLETDLSNLVQESTESAERYEGEIEEQKRVAQTISTELEKEKVDKRRVVGILVQCRAAETALREQVEECVVANSDLFRSRADQFLLLHSVSRLNYDSSLLSVPNILRFIRRSTISLESTLQLRSTSKNWSIRMLN